MISHNDITNLLEIKELILVGKMWPKKRDSFLTFFSDSGTQKKKKKASKVGI